MRTLSRGQCVERGDARDEQGNFLVSTGLAERIAMAFAWQGRYAEAMSYVTCTSAWLSRRWADDPSERSDLFGLADRARPRGHFA